MSFELGPIRPPSEANSLLIRLTRNCPWNKCAFCATYRGETFSRRSLVEIKKDIDSIKEICDGIKRASLERGLGGAVDAEILRLAYSHGDYCTSMVANWLYTGGENVFLQDANSLVMKTTDLVEVLLYLKEKLPSVSRITSYARSSTVARKSAGELAQLAQAGLSRIHIGMESGSDKVLAFINKGASFDIHREAGLKVKAAGISLSEYVILGLGGREFAQEHPLETARLLNAINPDFIRFRTLAVVRGTQLYEKRAEGLFHELSEDEIIREERLLVASLEGITSNLVSDHDLNLLGEVMGKLPGDQQYMLGIMDRYLEMPATERANFSLGRRWGMYRSLDDMKDAVRYGKVKAALLAAGRTGLEGRISQLKGRML